MSYGRMVQEEARLKEEIAKLLTAAERVDEEEDAQLGEDVRGDGLPAELARREKRLEAIQAAQARLEVEADFGEKPEEVLADVGYNGEEELAELETRAGCSAGRR